MTTTLPSPKEMYRALLKRDAAYNGIFYVGVRTTGIFCRPVCPAKKPKAENVEFFASARDSLHAGYRPCSRCRPMDAEGPSPAWVRQLMKRVDHDPQQRIADRDLRMMSIEPAGVRRYFKEHYGMTFQAYLRARRMGLALNDIRRGEDLTSVGLRHGFDSASGFRDAFARVFGDPPGKGRDKDCLVARWLDTPLGAMLAAASDEGLCLLEFVDRRALETQIAVLRKRLGCAVVPGDNKHLAKTAAELERYFAGELREFTVPLIKRGTEFQVAAWERLLRIPYGQTLSYARMARDIGRPDAQRAVGRANGDNRIAIVIPCHRVVRADGTLCGYGGGLWRKQWLLDLERRVVGGEQDLFAQTSRGASG